MCEFVPASTSADLSIVEDFPLARKHDLKCTRLDFDDTVFPFGILQTSAITQNRPMSIA